MATHPSNESGIGGLTHLLAREIVRTAAGRPTANAALTFNKYLLA